MTSFGFIKLISMCYLIFCMIFLIGSYVVFKRIIRIVKIMVVGGVLLCGFWLQITVIEPNWIAIERVKIKDVQLAEIFRGLTVVQLTDIHLHNGVGYREKKMLEIVRQLNPDIIFFTGDLLDSLSQLRHAKELVAELNKIGAVIAVQGNTDHIVMDSRMFVDEFEPLGMHVLNNENRIYMLPNGNEIMIAGVDDPKYQHSNLQLALAGRGHKQPVVLLSHSPIIFEQVSESDNINLIIAGDTHGAQVGIPWLVKLSKYANRTKYVEGLFHKGETKMYVSRGIGMKTLYIRFLCRPEIAVFDFVK